MDVLILLLQSAASVGFGLMLMFALKVSHRFSRQELLAWSFALGYGVVGWLMFFLGVSGNISAAPVLAVLILGAFGITVYFWLPCRAVAVPTVENTPSSWFALVIVTGVAVALGFDLVEALSPPTDGDTMAYHFDLPQRFIQKGGVFFVPRALDGAIPLLGQMTYIPPLLIGGERALTLWTMVSGWMGGFLLFVLARRFVSTPWAGGLLLLYMTTPAIIFGAGSGQVECRNVLFTLTAAFASAEAIKSGSLRFTILAGLAIGFFVASKLTGLIFAVACGVVILAQRQWFMHGLILTVTTVLVGWQWYLWNYIHIGDPIFPMLYNFLDYTRPDYWSPVQDAALKFLIAGESGVPQNLFWFFAFPFVATLDGYRGFESARTGFGVFILLVLPLSLWGLFKYKSRLLQSPLLYVALIALLFYTVWFFTGTSQRVRHLLPVYPLLLIAVTIAAVKASEDLKVSPMLKCGMLIVMVIQLAMHGVFSQASLLRIDKNESRREYLARTVSGYDLVQWVNQNLSSSDRLYTELRHLNYLINIPIYFTHQYQEGLVANTPEENDPAQFWRQLNDLDITHLLVSDGPVENSDGQPLVKGPYQWRQLVANGCASKIKSLNVRTFSSRTFAQVQPSSSISYSVVKISDHECRFSERS